MTPNRLREILLARGGRVPLDDLRKSDSYRSEADLNEAISFLLETELAVHHGDSVQAMRGQNRLVEPATRYVRAGEQNPLGVLPRMSSGAPRAAAKRIRTREKLIPKVIDALRRGVPEKEAMALAGFRSDIKQVSVAYRERLLEAKREGLALIAAGK